MGGCSIDANDSPLSDETLAAPNGADAGLLKLRKELGTYGDLHPCFFASDSLVDSSPLKAEVYRGTDFVIIREHTGDIYFDEPKRRLRLGLGHRALLAPRDKAKVLATSRLWRKAIETFEKEFPNLKVEQEGKCNGIYEPIHGSAPDMSGKGIVNPIGTILSVAMLLRYSLNLFE
ncbi:hypothetical protein FDECE_16378 [Fusarium decemcellulare]|nr:hypothetical protein FDECE_16378 [Fusarium decemcellulare]